MSKTPTASGISRLLSGAGFDRAVISIMGGNSGFKVEQCRTRVGAVKVRQYFLVSVSSLERYREKLRAYAKAIEAAGYGTEEYAHYLIVTAPPESTRMAPGPRKD